MGGGAVGTLIDDAELLRRFEAAQEVERRQQQQFSDEQMARGLQAQENARFRLKRQNSSHSVSADEAGAAIMGLLGSLAGAASELNGHMRRAFNSTPRSSYHNNTMSR